MAGVECTRKAQPTGTNAVSCCGHQAVVSSAAWGASAQPSCSTLTPWLLLLSLSHLPELQHFCNNNSSKPFKGQASPMNGFSKGRQHSHCLSPTRPLQGQAQLYLNSPPKRRNIHQPHPPFFPQALGSLPTRELVPHPALSPQAPTGTHGRGAGDSRFKNQVPALLNDAAMLLSISCSAAPATSGTGRDMESE